MEKTYKGITFDAIILSPSWCMKTCNLNIIAKGKFIEKSNHGSMQGEYQNARAIRYLGETPKPGYTPESHTHNLQLIDKKIYIENGKSQTYTMCFDSYEDAANCFKSIVGAENFVLNDAEAISKAKAEYQNWLNERSIKSRIE